MAAAGRAAAALTVAGVVLVASTSAGDEAASLIEPTAAAHPERPLVQGLFDLGGGRLDDALWNLERLVERQPDFTLARVVLADLLSVKAGRLDRLGLLGSTPSAAELRDEARARLARYVHSPPATSRPAEVLQLPESLAAAILVDLNHFRLFVLENRAGQWVRGSDYYISIGKGGTDKRREGDDKTPIGVYRVSEYLPGSNLPDMYGEGAFPIDYPNSWDRRRGRTGSGIWIHGTDWDRYSRAPLSSRGCVTLSNADFQALRARVEVGRTPVIVADRLSWLPAEEIESLRRGVAESIERWRLDWESLDTDRYLGHYDAGFQTGSGLDRRGFAAHKRRVNAAKSFVKVGLSDLSIYRYPGEDGLVLVQFQQRYQSDTFRASRAKQQFWRRSGERWKIVFES